MEEDREALTALVRINSIRERAGLPPLSMQQFLAMGGSEDDPNLNFQDFLVFYESNICQNMPLLSFQFIFTFLDLNICQYLPLLNFKFQFNF